MLLAKSVGAKGILVKTGHDDFSPYADYIVQDIGEARRLIMGAH